MENKNPKIIIISGKARQGKDTLSKYIKEAYEENNKKVINLTYAFYLKEYVKKITYWDGEESTKPRDILQTLGTEIIKEKIDKYFFTKRMITDIEVYSYYFDVIIISDARFVEEIEEIKKVYKNTTVIRIIRPNYDNKLTDKEKNHKSEIDLDDDYDKMDYVVINDLDLQDLKMKAKKIVEEV